MPDPTPPTVPGPYDPRVPREWHAVYGGRDDGAAAALLAAVGGIDPATLTCVVVHVKAGEPVRVTVRLAIPDDRAAATVGRVLAVIADPGNRYIVVAPGEPA